MDAVPIVPPLFWGTKNTTLHELQTGDRSRATDTLIEDPSIKRASGLIISITGGKDLMLFEVDEAATRIRDEADQDANIIIGASFDESLEGIVRVSVVATGIDNPDPASHAQPAERSLTGLAGRLRNDSRQIAGSSVVCH